MALKRILPLAALLVACQDQPTAVEVEQPDLQAAQGDRSEWEHWFTSYWEGVFFIPCFNGGEGEDALWSGYYTWSKKEVVTPSGNVLQNLKLTYEDVSYVGQVTGDVWTHDKIISIFFQHTRHSDGATLLVQPIVESLVNQDGDLLNMTSLYQTKYGADGSVELWRERTLSCGQKGPNE